jgi:ubiquitin-conjugating enzyme
MDNVRLRRLKADHEALRRLANLHPRIEIEGVVGNPPERYRLKLRVKSLRERGEAIEVATEHRLEVTMPRGYPRDAPLFRMLTPVFHPNIAPHAVCIGDDWTASETIDSLIQRVGEILAYQSYNTKSPLNGRAAAWVDSNKEHVPVDKEEFFIDLSGAAAPAPMAGTACSNCSAQGQQLYPCGNGHNLCFDCAMQCQTCQSVVCLACGHKTCQKCKEAQTACRNCNAAISGKPLLCDNWHPLCGDCGMQCQTCRSILCLVCGSYPCKTCAPAPMHL